MATVFVSGVDTYAGRSIAEVIAGSSAEFFPEGSASKGPLTVIGTLHDKAGKKPKCVERIVDAADKAALKAELLAATHIVYDITQHADVIPEAIWAIEALDAVSDDFAGNKVFVLVSTIMTWAKTKPVDPEDLSPIAEDEFRRRRPHLNFKAHLDLEKQVTKIGKKENTKLLTYVVCAGLLYGDGELLFHRFFKSAWQLEEPHLECYGAGDNAVPAVHVRDLGAIVSAVLTSTPPQNRYLLAVDDGTSTLEEILRSIADTLGNGVVKKIAKEDALTDGSLAQEDYDSLMINLRVDAAAIKDLAVNWACQGGLVESIATVIAEYRKARGLHALKVCVLGPPGAGKSYLAGQLCQHYKLPRIHIQGVIKSKLDRLNDAVAKLESPDISPEDSERADAAKEELAEARANIEANGGKYGEELLCKWVKETLGRGQCRNQGYVLDGFPKTTAHAKDIFGAAEEQDTAILPEFVFAFDATDEFLKDRIMALPESEVAGTHNSEEGLLRRLAKYRAENTEDNTVLNFFDLLEIHPISLAAESSNAPFERAIHIIGKPRNYGLTAAEQAALAASEAAKSAAAEARANEERTKLEAALAAEAAQAQATWAALRSEVQRQHAEARDQAALPLRSFLVKNVLPTLTKGLMELCDVRPEDPIDYLAEYLFKHNPRIE
eukprot:m.219923 g.219923  ORF g.219923 m.219923 type:complete len:665 (+) comp10277_c0_seq1:1060-3054(+)